ncbi:MAG TPA: alanine--glyoxylate aminotransferase family protein [Nitrososphaeria archaeon]|nr:alanine--glyoxylate aminotransferase family protein [Nitrososphaeria archaeon]
MSKVERPILMVPGPSEVPAGVLTAVSLHPMPYYGRRWGKIFEEVREMARKPFGSSGEILLIPAPYSAALEMGIANLVPPDGKLLVIVNGFCGERIVDIAHHLGREVVTVEADYGQIVKPSELKSALQENPDANLVATMHSETSTGVRNPVKTYGKIVQENSNALFMVDASSSYGGMDLRVDEWSIDYCVGHCGMAISGLTGITPVAVSPRAERIIEDRKWKVAAWFLDLKVWKESIDKWSILGRPYPTEVPTHTILAFREALRIVLSEGLEKRYERHIKMATAFREAIRAMGLETVAPDEYASSTITVIKLPSGMPKKLIQEMLHRFNILLARGMGKLENTSVRVGHMGMTASIPYLVYTITGLAYTLRKLGFEADEGTALEAFYSSLGTLP